MTEVCTHHLHTPPVAPSVRLGRQLPPGLDALILWCLEKDRDRRPQTAQDLLERLLACSHVDAWSDRAARNWWAAYDGPAVADGVPGTVDRSALTRSSAVLSVDLSSRP
jgi:serine/threonine-protein kinase